MHKNVQSCHQLVACLFHIFIIIISFFLPKNPHLEFFLHFTSVVDCSTVCVFCHCFLKHPKRKISSWTKNNQGTNPPWGIQATFISGKSHEKAALGRVLIFSNTVASCFAAHCVAPKDRRVHTSPQQQPQKYKRNSDNNNNRLQEAVSLRPWNWLFVNGAEKHGHTALSSFPRDARKIKRKKNNKIMGHVSECNMDNLHGAKTPNQTQCRRSTVAVQLFRLSQRGWNPSAASHVTPPNTHNLVATVRRAEEPFFISGNPVVAEEKHDCISGLDRAAVSYFITASFSFLRSLTPQGDLQQRLAATAATSAAAACIICKSTDKCAGRISASLCIPRFFSLLLCRVREEQRQRAEEVVAVDGGGGERWERM